MQFSSPNQIDKNNDNTHVHLPNSHYILIVDDESDILSVVGRLLEESIHVALQNQALH